jgi:hypothetical protein
MPTYVAATAWYLIICSVLMVGQYYLEPTASSWSWSDPPAAARRPASG